MKQLFFYITKNSKSLWLLLFFYSNDLIAQNKFNLVPNYSFEDSVICPSAGNYYLPKPWYRPINYYNQNGLYYNSCSTIPNGSVPKNYSGYQFAHTGNGYCNMTTYDAIGRIYIQVKLRDSLRKNKVYSCTLYISSGERGELGSDNVTMLITNSAIYPNDTLNDPNDPIIANAQIQGYGNPIITDTLNWTKISGIYKAQGGEQYITIGNFKQDNQTTVKRYQPQSSQLCYCAGYFLDDVSVIPLDSFCLKADAGKDTNIKAGDSVFIGSYTNGIDTLRWLQNNTVIDSTRPGFWVKPTTATSYVLCQVVNGCATCDTVKIGIALPLKFTSFVIFPSSGGVRGGFTTANEINVSHYLITKSTDGRTFKEIGKVVAKNLAINEYSFIDEERLQSPPPVEGLGVVYYQIIGIDKDGRKTNNEVKRISINNVNGINIFPNPTKGLLFINLPNINKPCWQITVTDMLGKQIAEKTIRNNAPKTFVELKGNKGLYFVKVFECNSGLQKIAKIIME